MKRTKLLLALVAVVVLCLSLAACDSHTHTYGEWTLTTQPTETATGEATRTCTECGEAETVTVAALSDTTVWTASTTAATHTEDGKTVYTSDYGTVEIKLPKLADNHVFDKQVVETKYLKSEATCTEAAIYYKSCACGESSKEHGGETFTTGEALGHDFHGEETVVKSATCTEKGSKTIKCTRCDETKTEEIPVDPNAHNAETDWTIDTPATCTENGSRSHHCEYCDTKLDSEDIPATGHSDYQFVDWATEPTETAAGVANVTCGVCSAKLTQDVSALAEGDDWTVTTTPATYDEAGSTVYTSTKINGATVTKTIDRLIAPYEGKTYQVVGFGNSNGYINGKTIKDGETSYEGTYTLIVGEAGLSTDTIYRPDSEYNKNGKVQFSEYNPTTGKFKVVFAWDNNSSSGSGDDGDWEVLSLVADNVFETWGKISADGSMLYISTSESGRSHFFGVQGEEIIHVPADNDARILFDNNSAVYLQLGTATFFVNENNVVFGTTLADLEGKALTIANYTDSDVVIVKSGDSKIAAYANVPTETGKANYVATDGYEGIYTGEDGEQAYINGVGGITVKGADYELVGIYNKVEGRDNEFDVMLANNSEYYLVTLTGSTYTKNKVMAVIYYELDGGTLPDGKTSDLVNIKVEFTLPTTPTKEGYKFLGWYTTPTFDEDTRVETITLEQAEGDHTYYALFAAPAKVTFYNLDDGSNSGEILVNVGESILAAMPGYVINETKSKDGTKLFVGWYYVDGEDESLLVEGEDLVLLEESGSSISIRAKWANLNTLKLVYGHGIEDKELYMALNDNVAEIIAAANANIKYNAGRLFVGWLIADENGNVSESSAMLGENDLCSGDMTLVAKWNEDVNWSISFGSSTNYPFVYDATTKTWKSSNFGTGVDTTNSKMIITATGGAPLEVSFTLDFVKDSSSDKIYLRYYQDGTYKTETISSGGTKTFVGTIVSTSNSKQEIQIEFYKYMLNKSSVVTLSNLTINGVEITTPNSPDFMDGTYTNETLGDLVLNGFGAGSIGGEALTYTVAAKDAGYTLLAKTANKTYKVTLNGSTYTAVEWNVMVSFDLGVEGQTLEDVTLAYGTNYTLPDGKEIEGYIFRGWYKEEGFVNKITSIEVTDDVTVYAKYDPAVTLTFDYNGQGTENVVINGKFKGDTIGNVIPDASELTKDGQSFVGWFLKDGENWGEKATEDTILEGSVTYYAKWSEPPKSVGVYKGWNLYGNKASGSTQSSFTKDVLTVNMDGTFAYSSKTGTLTAEQMQIVDGSMVLDGTYYYFNKELGAMWRKYNGGKADGVGTDTDLAFLEGTVTSVDYCGSADFGNCYVSLMQITYANGDVKTAFLYNNKIVANVTLPEGKSFKNALSGSVVVSKDGVAFVKLANNKILNSDGLMGEYTGEGTLSLNGFGDFTVGDISGTYTKAAEEAGYTLLAMTNTQAYKITLSGSAYTMEAYNVTVSFDFGDLAELAGEFADQTVSYGISIKLNTAPTIEGYKFRGWYENAEFSGSAKTTVTLKENKTYYAKYDPAVELIFDYNGQGTAAVSINNKYVGDYVSDIPDASALTYEGKAFAGWFLKDGDNWGAQASTSYKLTGNTTFFAKWVNAPASYGTFKGWNMDENGNSESKTISTLSTVVFKVDVVGNYSGSRLTSGTLTDEQAAIADGSMVLGRYVYFNKAAGIVWYGYNSSETGVGNDTMIGFDDTRVNKASIFAVKSVKNAATGNEHYALWIAVEYKDGTTKMVFCYEETVIYDVVFSSGSTVYSDVTKLTKATKMTISEANGNLLYAYDNGNILVADGLGGTYTGEYGAIELDGYGTLTIGGESVAYTADGNKITFVAANAMRVVELGEGSYTKVQDGYQGTYTLPDAGTITLDGYGNAGENATYVVSGTSITIYTTNGSTTYGIDVDNKQLLGKSVFAGLTFTGTYIAQGESTKIMFIFDDSSMLTGVVQTGSFSGATIKFTATFDGTTLVLTFDAENEVSWDRGQTWKSGDFGGKNIVATLSGNTFTIVSTTAPGNAYTFANSGTLTCPDYAA